MTVWVLGTVVAVGLVVSFLTLCSSLSDPYNSFGNWSPEKQVEAASVIAVGEWQKSGSTLKCIISEILKQAPNTAFYYKVGEEIRAERRPVRENIDYGDGEVMFFTGSPPTHRFSASIRGNRISGMGDMPMDELRRLIHQSPK